MSDKFLFCVLASVTYIFFIYKFSVFLFKTKFNLLLLFSGWWLFNLNLAIYNPLGFYEISTENIILFLSPLIIFPCGMYLSFIKNSKKKKTLDFYHINPNSSPILDKIVVVSNAIVFFVALLLLYSSYSMAARLGLSVAELRTTIFSVEQGSILALLAPVSWVSSAVNTYCILYFTYYFLVSIFHTKNYLFGRNLILCVLNSFLFSMAVGGRLTVINLLWTIVSILLFMLPAYKKIPMFRKILKRKKLSRKFYLFALLIIIYISFNTFLRQLPNENFSDSNLFAQILVSYITNYAGPFFGYDQLFQTYQIDNLVLDRFGISFMGLDSIIVSLFLRFLGLSHFIGLDGINSILAQTSGFTQYGVSIKNGFGYNAFFTIFFSLYVDGGYVYIAFFLLTVSFLFAEVYYSSCKEVNFKNFSFVVLFYLYFFNMVRTNMLELPYFVIAIILISITPVAKYMDINYRTSRA